MSVGERVLRATGGALCAGLAVLAVVLIAVWLVAISHDDPGPRARVLVGHLAAAVVAVALQRIADRRPDRLGRLASTGVVLLTGAVVALFWWT
ncbi:MAG TPA: hypothetical protein VK735_29720 [Pseudonocardia sp.]|jgi:hypothetical protein|uniref:hypothetical protein n=1 Tax=Pseudonocardia sp. TaxID=60912 RepID=UPI002C38E319|nr:hypothetical protein [Pseudonocardia sp.]HTF51645.1 hypothetical protein [Pseudonocardia sp.]